MLCIPRLVSHLGFAINPLIRFRRISILFFDLLIKACWIKNEERIRDFNLGG